MSITGTAVTFIAGTLGINLMKPEDFAPYRMWFTYPGLLIILFIIGFGFDIWKEKRKTSKKKWLGKQ